MSNAIVVRYTTTPSSADENARLVREVYEELATQAPEGFHYLTVRLDDGVSFVHVSVLDDGAENPLPSTAAFGRFQENLASRLTEGPMPTPATLVGAYGLAERG
jgi:hypothetical protein